MQFSPYGGNGTAFAPSDVVEHPANFEDRLFRAIHLVELGA